MYHRLLITGLVVAKLRILLQRLAYARNTSMAENPKTSGKESVLLTVALGVLTCQILDQRLGHRQTNSLSTHVETSIRYSSPP